MKRAEARAHLAAALIPKARQKAREDLAGFVRRFVHIENVDSGAPTPFDLWPKQAEVLGRFEHERLLVVLKARQLGLTWLALAYACWRMLSRPGYRVVCLSKGENEAKELVRRVSFILRHMSPVFVVGGKARGDTPGWEGSSEKVAIHHPGGEDSSFLAFASAPDSGRAFTASLVILDEWAFQPYAKEIWSAAYPTINRPEGGGQVIGLSTGRRGTFFEEVWAQAPANGFSPIFLDWRADPRRDAKWYEQSARAMPVAFRQEYPTNPADAFTAGEGAAFSEFDEAIHAPFGRDWYPPDTWRIVRAYDAGYMTRACCKWYAVSHDGWVVCYREYYPHMAIDAEQAEEIRALSFRPDGRPEEIAYTIADPAAWQKKSGTGISTAEVFSRHGIHMRPADNDRVNGWKRLHEWFRPFVGADGEDMARLRYTQSCANTLRTYPALLVDKARPDDIDTDGEDHCADCDRYFVMSRPAAPVTEDEMKERQKTRRKRVAPVVSKITGY